MTKQVEIEVFNIARTRVDKEEVQRWLDYLGVQEFDWPNPQVVTEPAFLVALAGKRCYMSFEKGLNPNVTKIRKNYVDYFDNILSSRHGSVLEHAVYSYAIEGCSRVFCYHPGTEILTQRGWKNITDISDNEILLTKDPKTGLDRWSENKKLHEFNYDGELYYWKTSKWTSPPVTPDHTMWVKKVDTRVPSDWEKIQAKEIALNRMAVDHRVSLESVNDLIDIKIGNFTYDAELFFEWLGFFVTDGCFRGNQECRIYQSKSKYAEDIRRLFVKLFGNRFREGEYTKEYFTFMISDPELFDWVLKHTGGTLKKDRDFLGLMHYSPRLLTKFLEGGMKGDGHITEYGKTATITCTSKKLARGWQTIAALVGRSSNIQKRDEIGKSHLINGVLTVTKRLTWVVSIHVMGNGETWLYKKKLRKRFYSGKVYCPETEDGLVYVRYKGMSVWCGNTAEMNRHRAGWAISEGSLRFIRFDKNIPYWIPTSLRDHPDDDSDLHARKEVSRLIIDRAFQDQEKAYSDLVKLWEMEEDNHNFAYKKKITSQMRRIVGMGVATGGVWTGNIRALRHVIAMRTDPAAEEEIFLVAGKIARDIITKEPLLFGDFEETKGSFIPKNWKV
jgi:thymidylate synthase ThyX